MIKFHFYDEQSVNRLKKNALAVCQFPLSVNSGGLWLLKIKEPFSIGKFGKNFSHGLNRLLLSAICSGAPRIFISHIFCLKTWLIECKFHMNLNKRCQRFNVKGVFRTIWSRGHDVVLRGRTIELGEPLEGGKMEWGRGRSVYKQPGTRVDEDCTTQKGGIPSK